MSLGTVLLIILILLLSGGLAYLAVQHRLGLLSFQWPWLGRAPPCDPLAHRQNLSVETRLVAKQSGQCSNDLPSSHGNRLALGFRASLKVKT
jgi:hypothetical protein